VDGRADPGAKLMSAVFKADQKLTKEQAAEIQAQWADAQTATTISLEVDCPHQLCRRFSEPLFEQMSEGFPRCAAMPLPADMGEWAAEHRTARKRANRAERRGYTFGVIKREDHADELFEINTSAERRQGRRMSESYLRRYQYSPLPEYPCERHQVRTYGVKSPEGRLVAYLWLYVACQLRLCSSIIGHAAHLENEIMYLLFRGMLEAESQRDPDGIVVYHRWDNGTDGLRFYKERVGLKDTPIGWQR
jgi:hypothetical protein